MGEFHDKAFLSINSKSKMKKADKSYKNFKNSFGNKDYKQSQKTT